MRSKSKKTKYFLNDANVRISQETRASSSMAPDSSISSSAVAEPRSRHLEPIQPHSSRDHELTPYTPVMPNAMAPTSAVALLPLHDVVSQKLTVWPSARPARRSRSRLVAQSKSPLALQLEAFIRREHKQYLVEHPACSRADTLHIFREAFSTLVDHFSEYRGVLHLIRDEYDAALSEMAEQVKLMQVARLESQSDRSLHAMELMQLKESMNATISNQQAQLNAYQGLSHTLRDQLAAAEHANSLLSKEIQDKRATYIEAQDQVKLLSDAMIEESSRTAAFREASRKIESEMQLQVAQIKVLRENIAELEQCLRLQVYSHSESKGGSAPIYSSFPMLAAVEGGTEASGDKQVYSKGYVSELLARLDAMTMDAAKLSDEEPSTSPEDVKTSARPPKPEDKPMLPKPTAAEKADSTFLVIRRWLQAEGISEADVESTDYLLPPGHSTTEDMGFLNATQPVKNRHLSLKKVLDLIEEMWSMRERSMSAARLTDFFADWLQTQTGNLDEAKALGVNILHVCQYNLQHPECRALLVLLRGFLPEQLVLSWRKGLLDLQQAAEASLNTVAHKMPFEEFFTEVRRVCPDKSIARMLQLRFYIYRHLSSAGTVDLNTVLRRDSYFVFLFKLQWMQEVESFTLQVVEGVREISDPGKNTVPITKSVDVLRALDPSLSEEYALRCIAECAQKPLIDISSAGEIGVARMDVVMQRMRSAVLFRRWSPADALVGEAG